MNRWTTKYLGLAALPFLACDDAPSFEATDVDAQSVSARAASDVLVVVFETRQLADVGVNAGVDAGVGAAWTRAWARAWTRAWTWAWTGAGAGAGVDVGARWLIESGRLVLAQGDKVDAGWSTGEPTLVQSGDPKGDGLFIAHKALVHGALPAELTGLVGAEVKVFDDMREVCVARVAPSENFRLDAKLVHLPDGWNEDDTQIVPSHSAAEVFEQGLSILSAELVPLMGDCAGGIWAAPIAAPSPILFRKAALAKNLAREAIAAFRTLPAWRAAQDAMLGFWVDVPRPAYLKGKRWDTFEGAKPEATLYRSHDGARELVVIYANSHSGCGSEGQQVSTLFELVTTGKGARFVELASMPWKMLPVASSTSKATARSSSTPAHRSANTR